jgi:hypothetical protein
VLRKYCDRVVIFYFPPFIFIYTFWCLSLILTGSIIHKPCSHLNYKDWIKQWHQFYRDNAKWGAWIQKFNLALRCFMVQCDHLMVSLWDNVKNVLVVDPIPLINNSFVSSLNVWFLSLLSWSWSWEHVIQETDYRISWGRAMQSSGWAPLIESWWKLIETESQILLRLNNNWMWNKLFWVADDWVGGKDLTIQLGRSWDWAWQYIAKDIDIDREIIYSWFLALR